MYVYIYIYIIYIYTHKYITHISSSSYIMCVYIYTHMHARMHARMYTHTHTSLYLLKLTTHSIVDRLKVEPLSDIQFPTNDDTDEGGEGDQMIQLEGETSLAVFIPLPK